MISLPYRPCAGIVLMRARKVFAGQRVKGEYQAWQMPQGGIDNGETPKMAALRELEEETGIKADMVTILDECKQWLYYDIPSELIGKLWGGQFRGQKQKWFLMRFDADDNMINIETKSPEFSAWKWMTPEELFTYVVAFKRDTYRCVFKTFGNHFN